MNAPLDHPSFMPTHTHRPITDLPWAFRILHIVSKDLPNQMKMHHAELYHDKASVSVAWTSRNSDDRLVIGKLVTPRWSSQLMSTGGKVIINRLLPLEKPSLSIHLFDTIPYEWMKNRSIIQEASRLTSMLPDYFVRLINAIFWDQQRFYRFITGPSSLNGHHHSKHGNFIHTIEVANNALKLCEGRLMVSESLLLIGALLHDAAKADEYDFNVERRRFEISTRGALIGHKLTIIEWIASAIAQYNIEIPEAEYLGLIHLLSAVKGAPDWIGLREPVSPECHLLSMADRLSGHDDLLNQTKPKSQGFGGYHKHLRGRPYIIQPLQDFNDLRNS